MFRKVLRQLLATVAGLTLLVPAARSTATVGDHPPSETPGSNQAVVFSPFGWLSADDKAAMLYVEGKVRDHNYSVTEYIDKTEASDDEPQGATVDNFLALSGKGIVFMVSHGLADGSLLVEGYKSTEARWAMLASYYLRLDWSTGSPRLMLPPGELIPCDTFNDHAGNTIFGICITRAGIAAHFADNNSIVHIAACYSWVDKDDFKAREYFGYSAISMCPQIRSDTEAVWGRMHGEKRNGEKRAARVAYADAHAMRELTVVDGAVLKHQHRDNLDTVLSPAVEETRPAHGSNMSVGGLSGEVVFDTRMDQTVDATTVITVTGCGVKLYPGSTYWSGPFSIHFDGEVNETGTAIFTVDAAKARAERTFKNNLDGNGNTPGNPPHVGPNRDNYAWRVTCVNS